MAMSKVLEKVNRNVAPTWTQGMLDTLGLRHVLYAPTVRTTEEGPVCLGTSFLP